MKFNIIIAVAATVFSTTLASGAALAQASQKGIPGLYRTDVQRHDSSIPGYEVIQDRVDIEPGVVAPNHRHPGEEVVYVIEGALEYDLQGRPPAVLKAGDGLTVPAGVPHIVKNLGTSNGAELGTYVVPKGKPLFELAP
ncbi:cupin domain-containing protein [Pinirhizobacter sp.]|jgi:quercetin dioxygenase-like cupin family protein|uniref:cupin domain-containing protein n=1 Tax=Pinirhizobacter sp. TaxID=2950432 RepID=UPI002F414224